MRVEWIEEPEVIEVIRKVVPEHGMELVAYPGSDSERALRLIEMCDGTWTVIRTKSSWPAIWKWSITFEDLVDCLNDFRIVPATSK